MLSSQSPESRKDRIRSVFEEENVAIPTLVQRCIDRGVFTAEDIEAYARRGLAAECRNALKQKGTLGAPPNMRGAFPVPGGKDEDGPLQWKQSILLDYGEWCFVCRTLGKGIEDDYSELEVVAAYVAERFGRSPEIIKIVTPTEA